MFTLDVSYKMVLQSVFRFHADPENMQKFAQILASHFRFPAALSVTWTDVSDNLDSPMYHYKIEVAGDSAEFQSPNGGGVTLANLLNRHAVAIGGSVVNIIEL